jgi:hypothetical protein
LLGNVRNRKGTKLGYSVTHGINLFETILNKSKVSNKSN